MKALILDSSRLYRQLLDKLLAQQGFDTDITDELKTDRELLGSNRYDLLCLNEHLKDGSGLDLVRACKHDPQSSDIPILFFTADTHLEDQLKTLGVDAIIPKNNLQQINDQIQHFVEERLDPLFREGRILFIEDSSSIAGLIGAALQDQGYRIDHFPAADRAWEAFVGEVSYGSDQEAFDLVLTDIQVEGCFDGHELIRRIRKIDDARGFVPIIALTAQDDPKLRLALYREGVNDFIRKPIMVEELLIRVHNLITNKRLLDKVHDQRRELFALATTEKLTGCHNRHSLMDFSKKFIAQAIRHQFPVSLMVIDLDHFKRINDTHGHATGDIVLQEVGELLNRSFREGDLVARFGGEEFVVLLDHCDARGVSGKAEPLRQAIEQLRPADLTVTASIGTTAMEPPVQRGFEALFAAADEAVYRAKEGGRNRVEFQPCVSLTDSPA
jgi:two-component system cell cycle response regulator